MYLTDLDFTFPKATLPTHIVQLMRWMQQAPLLATVAFSFRHPDAHTGLAELILGFLLISPEERTSGSVISPLLTNLTLTYTAVLPSLLLQTIAQRDAFRERLGESHDPSYTGPFQIKLDAFWCPDPLLRDGVSKGGCFIEGPCSLSQIRRSLNCMVGDIGAGDFDAVALSRISDPEERIRALCSLLHLPLDV